MIGLKLPGPGRQYRRSLGEPVGQGARGQGDIEIEPSVGIAFLPQDFAAICGELSPGGADDGQWQLGRPAMRVAEQITYRVICRSTINQYGKILVELILG